ncbi:hypothetical protein ALC57_03149 [Trachymyrmex cornetzi]|uniref:Uncharacterized protein n=1 Tax=Trachymyrmex cornetzi TaxID=471704 RepID=A0A151JMB1_9HYME|nr:hypothetical protein ALC57_03149 [Trachymyrmex cornetzi]
MPVPENIVISLNGERLVSVSRFILEIPTFCEPCSPLHQGEEQRDTELLLQAVLYILGFLEWWGWSERGKGLGTAQYQAAPRPDEVDCKVHKTLASQEWIWTRRKPAKLIIFIQKALVGKPQEY